MNNIQVHSFNKHKRLSVLQFSSLTVNTFNYISGPSAINNNLVEVREINVTGNVNKLELENFSDQYVFFMDGDILVGAKQNRVLNTSVLVAPNTKITLPVSCVEQGRWRTVSDKFRTSNFVSPDLIRAKKLKAVTKHVKKGLGHFADQGEIWNNVYSFSKELSSYSNSNDLDEIMNKKRENIDSIIDKFHLNQDSNGLAIFTDNNLLSIDLFNRTDIYKEYYLKRLRGAAIEIIKLDDKQNDLTETEANFKTLNIFDELEKIQFTENDGVGVGKEKHWDNDKLVALELMFNEHMIHFTLMNIEKLQN